MVDNQPNEDPHVIDLTQPSASEYTYQPPIQSPDAFNPLAVQRRPWDTQQVVAEESPWGLAIDNPLFFTSTRTRLLHLVIPPSSYVPTLSPFVSLEKGQFSFDRFFHQDTESLPPFLVPWCFLGMVVLPTSQQLFDPTQNPHQQRPPYAAALLHTPSLINNNWLRQVLPHSSSDIRSSHAEYSAVDLLDVALEASTHATAPF